MRAYKGKDVLCRGYGLKYKINVGNV